MSDIKNGKQTAARLLIRSLVQQNVKHIFGIPGGKIMSTFDVLRDEGARLVVCRHEQSAALMSAAEGRLTGRSGVYLVTSGPGTGNLVTGAATATTEGDAMVAICGVVPLPDTLKQTHQGMDWVAVMKPVTKVSVAIDAPDAAGEPVVNVFRAAMAPRPGASSIAVSEGCAECSDRSRRTAVTAPSRAWRSSRGYDSQGRGNNLEGGKLRLLSYLGLCNFTLCVLSAT
jgi:acetolactate synthase-1/2/3 large subunit